MSEKMKTKKSMRDKKRTLPHKTTRTTRTKDKQKRDGCIQAKSIQIKPINQ